MTKINTLAHSLSNYRIFQSIKKLILTPTYGLIARDYIYINALTPLLHCHQCNHAINFLCSENFRTKN